MHQFLEFNGVKAYFFIYAIAYIWVVSWKGPSASASEAKVIQG